MKIHVARNNQQLGQFTADEINAGFASGRFHPSDLAWWEGAAGWVKLETAPGVVVPGGATPHPFPAPAAAPAKGKGMSGGMIALIVVGGLLVLAVPIIGLLSAIAIPNFVKARTTAQQRACIANLKQIDGAVQLWALENKKSASDTYTLNDPLGVLAFLRDRQLPVCPAGGVYSPGKRVSDEPTCNIPGHKL